MSIYFDYESVTEQRRRNLPHWDQDGVIYFVTFRLWDSIPNNAIEEITQERIEWRLINKIESETDLRTINFELKKEYYKLFSERIDKLLDNGFGSCILNKPSNSLIIQNALEYFDSDRYRLGNWFIMPNHIHILVKPLKIWSLSEITHSWKSYTANKLNLLLGRKGQLWMHESFDHIVRSSDQLQRIQKYIIDNPKGLPNSHYRIFVNSLV